MTRERLLTRKSIETKIIDEGMENVLEREGGTEVS